MVNIKRLRQLARAGLWAAILFLIPTGLGCAEGMAYRELQDVLREYKQPIHAKITPVFFPDDRSTGKVPNLDVKPGEYIDVTLQSAGATGYEWKLAPFPLRAIRIIGSRVRQLGDKKLAGGPVATDFLLKVKPGASGGELVCFILYRSWEGVGKTDRIAAVGLQYGK